MHCQESEVSKAKSPNDKTQPVSTTEISKIDFSLICLPHIDTLSHEKNTSKIGILIIIIWHYRYPQCLKLMYTKVIKKYLTKIDPKYWNFMICNWLQFRNIKPQNVQNFHRHGHPWSAFYPRSSIIGNSMVYCNESMGACMCVCIHL